MYVHAESLKRIYLKKEQQGPADLLFAMLSVHSSNTSIQRFYSNIPNYLNKKVNLDEINISTLLTFAGIAGGELHGCLIAKKNSLDNMY